LSQMSTTEEPNFLFEQEVFAEGTPMVEKSDKVKKRIFQCSKTQESLNDPEGWIVNPYQRNPPGLVKPGLGMKL